MWNTILTNALGTSILIILLSMVILLVKRNRDLKLPPGPRGLPIVGFLPFMSATEPHRQLDEMRKKYGDVFGMYMGSKYFLILSNIDSTKEAFNRDDYALRPEGIFEISKDFSMFSAANGQHWVDHRSLAIRAIRELGTKSNAFQEEVVKQISWALDHLDEKRSESVDGEVSLREAVQNAIVRTTCSVVCGKTYAPDHEVSRVMAEFLKAFAEHATAFSIDHFFPWLKTLTYYIIPTKTSRKRAFKDMEKYFRSEIHHHETNPVDEPDDFLHYYLAERSKPNKLNSFKRLDMIGDAVTILFAASDTTRTSTEWFLLCMAKFSQVQDRLYHELCDNLGSCGLPDYDQRHNTPYAEACILESLRFRTLAPIIPHGSPSTVTTFCGYDIPARAVIISNLWSIHNDPKTWNSPDTFDPERFLSADKKSVHVPGNFVPFSTGKRVCIGSKLSLKEMYLFGLSFLQRFQVLPPKDGVNMNGRMRVSWEAISPTVRLVPRNA